MQHTLKTLVAAAALAAAGIAHADTTVNAGQVFNGNKLETSSNGALSFSASLISALNIGGVTVAAVAPATVVEGSGPDPFTGAIVRNSSTATAPIGSVTLDDAGNVLRVATTGGAKMTAVLSTNISLGGTLEVNNLAVDLTNKRIYASITGNFDGVGTATGIPTLANNNITTKTNFHLWNYADISGPTVLTGPGEYENSITGLTITSDGYKHFVSALRLYSTGAATLTTVNDYGQIDSTISVTPAVPEPSTYAMAIAGLALVGMAARRRANKA